MVFTYFCLVTVNRVFLHFLLGFRLGYICLSLPCHQISIKNLNNAGNTESFVPIVFFIPFIKYILSKIPLTNFAPRSKFSIQDILYQQSFFLPQNTKIPSLLINLPTSPSLSPSTTLLNNCPSILARFAPISFALFLNPPNPSPTFPAQHPKP